MRAKSAGLGLAVAGLLTCTARAQVAYVASQPFATYASVGITYVYPGAFRTYVAPVAVAGSAAQVGTSVPTYSIGPVSFGAVSYPATFALPGWHVVPRTATSVIPAGYPGVVYPGSGMF